jgi:8-oxo-dGTP pyrophosphatase MutT (NUDIX family)
MDDTRCRAAGFIIYRLRNGEPQILGLIARKIFQEEANGIYDIPKGQRDEGEDPFQCALRECREEASLVPTNVIAGPFCHRSMWLWLAECDDIPTINVNPAINEKEHLGYDWLTPNQIIADCLGYLRKPLMWANEQIWKHHLSK